MARLDYVCHLNMGQSPDSTSYNDQGEGLPFFQGNADFGIKHPTVRVWCNAPTKVAHAGDVLISVRAPIGALNIATEDCCIGRGLAALTVNEHLCSTDYLWHAIASKVDELNAKGTGSTFKAISKNVLAETEIPLPSLTMQTRIAGILDRVDTLISLRKQQIAKLDELVKARFVEMFGDPEHWTTGLTNLGDHIELINGFAFLSEKFTESGIPVIKIRNVNNAEFSLGSMQYHPYEPILDKYLIFPGDILITLTGTVGKEDFANACMVDNSYAQYYLNQRNAKLVPHADLVPEYLLHVLKQDYIKKKLVKQGTGVRQCHLHNKDVNGVQLVIPEVEQQRKFAAFVAQTDKQKLTLQQSLAQLETLKKALMQKYFG